jgi:hypothetical protein
MAKRYPAKLKFQVVLETLAGLSSAVFNLDYVARSRHINP